jgi:hypothetical protein
MSQSEILSEIPKLSHAERREIVRCIIEAEEDAETLADGDRMLLENFLMLDAMEAEDKALLDRELEEYKLNPKAGSTWAEVEARLRKQSRA